jgi:hypothetical protein
MGWSRKAIHTTKCPWSVALADRQVNRWLTAYGLVERWRKWPPGREDPQLMEALLVIAGEHNRMDAERIEAARAKGK